MVTVYRDHWAPGTPPQGLYYLILIMALGGGHFHPIGEAEVTSIAKPCTMRAQVPGFTNSCLESRNTIGNESGGELQWLETLPVVRALLLRWG